MNFKTEFSDGIYSSEELPSIIYHREPPKDCFNRVSSTGLKTIARGTVADYVHRLPPSSENSSLSFGSDLHELVLEPDIFRARVETYPESIPLNKDGSISKSSKEFKAFVEEPDKDYLTSPQMSQLEGMRDALLKNKIFHAMLFDESAEAETSYLFSDTETGIPCQCRTDLTSKGFIIDLKTINKDSMTSASPANVVKSIANYGYDLQSEFYKHGYQVATNEEAKGFIFVFVEKVYPYLVALYTLDNKTQLAGIKKYRNALDEYADYVANPERNIGYSEEIIEIGLPKWAL